MKKSSEKEIKPMIPEYLVRHILDLADYLPEKKRKGYIITELGRIASPVVKNIKRKCNTTHSTLGEVFECDRQTAIDSKDGRDQDGGCPWCGRDCPDAGKPEGCWYYDCPDFPHGK
jgi:hypothetical protein|tara:strand:+ start:216 stop:563 length:348 start_codon:yes stop_codon:yes gene_type:complete